MTRFYSKQISSAALAALTLLLPTLTQAQAAPPAVVGILRPKVEGGANHMFDQVPAQYRAMVEAQMTAMQKQMNEQMPPAVARTWIELFQRKGIVAVALDAQTPEAGAKEAQAKGVSFLLASSVAGEKKAAGTGAPTMLGASRGVMVMGGGEQMIKLSLTVNFSMMDGAGHLLSPAKQLLCEGESQPANEITTNLKQDLWADCGNQIVTAVAAVLPLGTVRYLDPSTLLPRPPEIAESLRLDILINEQPPFKGRRPSRDDNDERAKRSTIEFAGDVISIGQRGKGILYTSGAERFFFIDDTARVYTTMTGEDFAFENSFGRAAGAQPSAPHLIRAGASGSTTRYSVSEGPAASPDATTTVEIEYGDPSPAWQRGIALMKHFSLAAGPAAPPPAVFREGSYEAMSQAIWAELATSPAPPRRILIHSAEAVGRKKTPMSTSSEILFDASQTPKPVDFTIPRDYQWHTNPMLNMIWMQ